MGFEKLQAEATNLEEKKKPVYISKRGFVGAKVRRGFTEISALWDILEDMPHDYVICGGYVRYMCSTASSVTPAGDVDVYCRDEEGFNALKSYFKKLELSIVHENNMAVTYKRVLDPANILAMCPVIQLIKPVKEGAIVAAGSIADILSNFDFTVVRAGLMSPKDALVDADFEHDETRKILRIKNIHCPVSSTLRCMKYSKKGYWLPPMQVVRLFLDWDERPFDWKSRLLNFLRSAESGEGLTQKDIDELEAMMRVD